MSAKRTAGTISSGLRGTLELLGVALVLAALRHVVFFEALVVEPAALIEQVDRQPVVREWARAAALQEIRAGRYQPVDLRRQPGVPFVGGQLAWQLPMPLSLTILERYRERATAERLMFLMTAEERIEGESMLRAICESLRVRDAGLCVWREE